LEVSFLDKFELHTEKTLQSHITQSIKALKKLVARDHRVTILFEAGNKERVTANMKVTDDTQHSIHSFAPYFGIMHGAYESSANLKGAKNSLKSSALIFFPPIP
jgi:hypothetical protein